VLDGGVVRAGVATEQADGFPAGLEEPWHQLGALVVPDCLRADLLQRLSLSYLENVHHRLSSLLHLRRTQLGPTELAHLHGETLLLAEGVVWVPLGSLDIRRGNVALLLGLLRSLVAEPENLGSLWLQRQVDRGSLVGSSFFWPRLEPEGVGQLLFRVCFLLEMKFIHFDVINIFRV
jgi:hypothetical protein